MKNSSQSEEFLSILNSFNLFTTIKVPTRVSNVSSTCIDNIITNLKPNLCLPSVVQNGLSDHLTQYLQVNCESITKKHIEPVVHNKKQYM